MTPVAPTDMEKLREALAASESKNEEMAKTIQELKAVNAEQLVRLVDQSLMNAHVAALELQLKASK